MFIHNDQFRIKKKKRSPQTELLKHKRKIICYNFLKASKSEGRLVLI